MGSALRIGLGVLGWLGVALVVAAVALRWIRPEMETVRNGLAIAGLACALLYMLSQWREIARMFSRRQTRLGTLTFASVVIVLGILGTINYIASRQNKRWDLTAAQQFRLSGQTERVLRDLTSPVTVTVFGREDDFARFRTRLDEFEYISNQIRTEYVDPDKNPALARQYELQAYGTAVFEFEGRRERVTSSTEQDLVNALIKVVEGQQKKVYFLQGHGEKDTVSAERQGYNAIADALARDNFSVEKLVLAQQPDVPDDASVVVVAGPQTDILPSEADALRRYLDKGGKLVALVDPPEALRTPPMTHLEGLLNDWGVELGWDIVVDASGVGQLIGTDASVPVAATYPSHPINEGFNLLTAFPLARSVSAAAAAPAERRAQIFIETSARSWAESDIDGLTATGRVELDPAGGDRQGPISIGVALSTPASEGDDAEPEAEAPTSEGTEQPERKPETRVAVIGDSDFAANFALGIQGNQDLFLNIVNWAAQQESLISVRPREPEDRRITLTADQQRRVMWLSLFIIPGLVLGTGVYTWWERR